MTTPCIEVIDTNSDNNNSINGNAQVCPIGPKSAQTITDRGPNSTSSSGGGGGARCAWVGGGAMGEFSVGRFDIVYLHFIRTSSIVITPSIRGRRQFQSYANNSIYYTLEYFRQFREWAILNGNSLQIFNRKKSCFHYHPCSTSQPALHSTFGVCRWRSRAQNNCPLFPTCE